MVQLKIKHKGKLLWANWKYDF